MKFFFSILFLLLTATAYPQVPGGGILLNASTGTTYQKIGNCTVSEETVTGQVFSEALQISVGANVSNAWDGQVKFPAVAGIDENDVVLVAFYARTLSSIQESGEGELNVCIEHNVSYAKELYYHITIGSDWKEYYAPVIIGNSIPAGSLNYAFHVGFPSQVIEVAEVRFLNYKNTLTLEDLPITEVSYFGRDPDASWRAPAAARINQIRKGQANITVYDQQGQELPDATISIKMVRHQFGFGTAIAANTFNSNSTYRNKVLEMFNEVVFENDLKWPQFNPDASNDHISVALDTLQAHNIGARGHNVIWPSFRWCPAYLESLRDNPVALRNAVDQRIDDVTGFTRNRLIDWDVMNEPYSEHELQDILGDEVMADWFKRVRRNDRGVKLYINDYSILSAGGNNTHHQDYYYNVIEYIDSLGGGIEGIGMQGHMGTDLTPISKVYEILERYAALGKDIKITEHDIDLTQRDVQADYTRDFMTILFSHPSVKSLLAWGFWEGRHWKPDGAFFDLDWTIRPHGIVWNDLIFNQWWTPEFDTLSDNQGHVSFEGFLGTYEYKVVYGEIERSGTFKLDHSHQSGLENHIMLSLDESMPDKVWINPSTPGFLCQGEEVVLEAPGGSGLTHTWFRNDTALSVQTAAITTSEPGSYNVMISNGSLELVSPPYELEVRPKPASEITASGELSFCEGESVILTSSMEAGLSYDWLKGNTRILGESSSLEVRETGSYRLRTTLDGCSSLSPSVEVLVDPTPEVDIEAFGDLTFCKGDELLLRTVPTPGLSYTWRNEDSILDSQVFWIAVSETGNYTVSATQGGCTASSDTVRVQVLPVPEANITVMGEVAFCEGSSVSLVANAGEGLSYTWSRDDVPIDSSDQSLVAFEEGSYTVTIEKQGCTAISDPVLISILSANDPQCALGIENNRAESRVYPNPFTQSFFLELSFPSAAGSYVEVFDSKGMPVLKQTIGHGSTQMNIHISEPGFYLLRVINKTEIQSHRIIAL